jgi:Holliday junction resolvase RusA-like endonuclease
LTTIIRNVLSNFPVIGKPVSSQAKNTKHSWQSHVTNTALTYHKQPYDVEIKLEVQVFWFSQEQQNRPDVDNILKPILDALKNVVYVDDNQVVKAIVSHHDLNNVIHFVDTPFEIIKPLLIGEKEYIYVRAYQVF